MPSYYITLVHNNNKDGNMFTYLLNVQKYNFVTSVIIILCLMPSIFTLLLVSQQSVVNISNIYHSVGLKLVATYADENKSNKSDDSCHIIVFRERTVSYVT